MTSRKLKVALADLKYVNSYNRGSLTVPINIGLIGSYLKGQFGADIDVRLFMDANELLYYARDEKPDVVGLSFYYWNMALDEIVSQKLRSLYGDETTIVWGGPSIDSNHGEQERLFHRFPYVDAFTVDEGEQGFANIVAGLLADRERLWQKPLDGAIYNSGGQIVRGIPVGLSTDLSLIESPYVNGLLDPFLDGDLYPLIQTSRLCPYTCAFCVSGKNRGKLRAFPIEQVTEEIDFVARRFRDRPHFTMMLADENFGILPRDIEIAQHIEKTAADIGFPKNVFFYNDKRFTQTSRDVHSHLGHLSSYGVTLALQTENPETLKAINRRNVGNEHIDDAIEWASSQKLPTATELIFGLPKETLSSFTQLLNRSVNRGFDSIISNTLFLVDGIEMNRAEYRETHGLVTKFRPLGTNHGEVDGEFSCEYEEIVTSTSDFTFEDWLSIRRVNFMFHAIFVLGFYKPFFQFVRQNEIPLATFVNRFFLGANEDGDVWPQAYLDFLDDLNVAIRSELFETVEEMKASVREGFERNGKNVSDPVKINLSFGARLVYQESAWVGEVLLRVMQSFLDGNEGAKFNDTAGFLIDMAVRERIDIRDETIPESIVTEYDVIAWQADKFRHSLGDYACSPKKLTFREQPGVWERIAEFKRDFSHYSESDFYYSVIEFFLPRSHLLYAWEYGEEPSFEQKSAPQKALSQAGKAWYST